MQWKLFEKKLASGQSILCLSCLTHRFWFRLYMVPYMNYTVVMWQP